MTRLFALCNCRNSWALSLSLITAFLTVYFSNITSPLRELIYLTTSCSLCQVFFSTFFKLFSRLGALSRRQLVYSNTLSPFCQYLFWKFLLFLRKKQKEMCFRLNKPKTHLLCFKKALVLFLLCYCFFCLFNNLIHKFFNSTILF